MFSGILFLLTAIFCGYVFLHSFDLLSLFFCVLTLLMAYASFSTSWTLSSLYYGFKDWRAGRRW
ncbi:hypothetical protein [Paenibacillus validus]|uniref:hypothetical protein n=1 Tax=Paenibacillus validus TaxID=44253 RepID=UPI003D27947D